MRNVIYHLEIMSVGINNNEKTLLSQKNCQLILYSIANR